MTDEVVLSVDWSYRGHNEREREREEETQYLNESNRVRQII